MAGACGFMMFVPFGAFFLRLSNRYFLLFLKKILVYFYLTFISITLRGGWWRL